MFNSSTYRNLDRFSKQACLKQQQPKTPIIKNIQLSKSPSIFRLNSETQSEDQVSQNSDFSSKFNFIKTRRSSITSMSKRFAQSNKMNNKISKILKKKIIKKQKMKFYQKSKEIQLIY